MSKVKTITVTSTEQEITFDATYQFMWFRNLGDNDCYVSDHSGIIAGADDVALCKAGECVRITLPQAPMSNKAYIKAVGGSNTVEIHAQNFSDKPTAKMGKGSGGGQSIIVEPLTVNDNGVYTAPTGKAYSPVTVDVQEQPWQPLEDGYSNFWFELTEDTLSPWLNFSAKNAGATIDWGDGSGEVALDTLSHTHTYAKAGRYVVKVKGVTRVARIFTQPFNINYNNTLKYIEFNNEVTHFPMYCYQYANGLRGVSIATIPVNFLTYVFAACPNLEKVYLPSGMEEIPQSTFNTDYSIKNITLPSSLTTLGISAFAQCVGLTSITLPSTITTLNNSALQACYSLLEVHCQATTPPTLGNNVFLGLPSDWLCYVPVGYGDTYKSAEGWSTYADHILEEGQTPNRMILAKFNTEETDEPQDDMR